MLHSRFRIIASSALLASAAGLLSGCDTSGLTRTFGFTRDAPDEFMVTTRAPLSMPPDFTLRPPRPGAPRPQEQSTSRQAEEALVPQMALGTPQTGVSPGQEALIQQAGPAPTDIRQKLDEDRRIASSNQSFVDSLLFWRKNEPEPVVVDPQRESQRLRENAALGENPTTGDTAIIQPRRKGWF